LVDIIVLVTHYRVIGEANFVKGVKLKLKLSLCLTKHHSMKAYGGLEVSGQLHDPDASPPGKEPLVPIG
jgi:hypothetical protein